MTITKDSLAQLMPGASPLVLATYAPILDAALAEAGMSTPNRAGMFIAQTAFESSNFMHTLELDSGQAYEGRKDLGNTQPGDGPRFKGRGLIQITGRNNYEACSLHIYKDTRLLEHPELLQAPDGAVRSAIWYWTCARPTMNTVCDQPENYSHVWKDHAYTKIQWITILINGGLNGIAPRTSNYQRACQVLGIK